MSNDHDYESKAIEPSTLRYIKSNCRIAAAGLTERQRAKARINLEVSIKTFFGIDIRTVDVTSVLEGEERLIYLNINNIQAANPTTSMPRSYRYYLMGKSAIPIGLN